MLSVDFTNAVRQNQAVSHFKLYIFKDDPLCRVLPLGLPSEQPTVSMSSLKVDCSQWMELNDFSSYIRLLGSKTQFKKDSLEVCQSEICTAVYGTGNPDISGIGVRLGTASQWVSLISYSRLPSAMFLKLRSASLCLLQSLHSSKAKRPASGTVS